MKTIKIGKFDVSKDDALLYVQHFGKDKSNLPEWEQMRKDLHNMIFENLKLNRFSDEGREFGKLFDDWAEPQILKYDPISASAKRFCNSEGKEQEASGLMLEMEIKKQSFMLSRGFRNLETEDTNNCRICKKELSGARINDHLMNVTGFKKEHSPICMDCSENNPDEYHKAFKSQTK